MKYESINELHTFCFDDCVITKFNAFPDSVELHVEALQVRPKNSQNTNFTLSYAGPSVVTLKEGKIESVVKEGYRYLDANGNVISETPDIPVGEADMKTFLHSCENAYWFSMELEEKKDGRNYYSMEIEFPGADDFDTAHNDAYEVIVSFTDVTVGWEFFQNRVEQ